MNYWNNSFASWQQGNRSVTVELLGNIISCMFFSFLLDVILHTRILISLKIKGADFCSVLLIVILGNVLSGAVPAGIFLKVLCP